MISRAAVRQLYAIIKKYVPEERMADLLKELAAVPGNKSYRDSVAELQEAHTVCDHPKGEEGNK